MMDRWKHVPLLLAVALAGLAPAGLAAQRDDDERDRQRDLEVRLRNTASRLQDLSSGLVRMQFQRAMLGVSIDDDDDGARIVSLRDGGPAEEAGLEEGDVIVAIDGVDITRPLADEDDDEDWSPSKRLVHLMGDVEPDDVVRVDYLRDGRRASVDVTASEPFGVALFDGGRLENRFRAVAPGSGLWRFSAFGGGFLGAHLADVNEGLGSYFGVDAGALVLELEGDDHDLGLQPGDVIVEIGGRSVEDAADAYRILGSYEEGERLRVVVMRQRSRTTLEGIVD